MFLHQAGITFLTAAIVAGCAATPIDTKKKPATNAIDIGHTVYDEATEGADYLTDIDPDSIGGCRKEATTGSRLRRVVCGRKKDDRGLLSIINSPDSSPD